MIAVQTHRIPFLALSIAALIIGITTGLSRLGFVSLAFPAMVHHGAIMTGGFLGTLITLEKIIPLKKRWLYIFPLLSALSVVFFLLNLTVVALCLLILASLGMSLTFLMYLDRERSLPYLLMLTGSLCWFIGNVMLLRTELYPVALGWWMCFVLFIIVAERIELMKFLPVTQQHKTILLVILALFPIGNVLSFHANGNILSGLSLIGCSLWLLRFDVISISLRKQTLTRFVAVALLAGYITLMLCGIFFVFFGNQAFAYDLTVHTFFIGFVFSMIFAHGPIILPGVLGVSEKPYHPILYLCLIVLELSLLLRIAGGVRLIQSWRLMSGILTTVGVFMFFVTLIVTIIIARRHSAKRKNVRVPA